MFNLLKALGYDVVNYDVRKGKQFDLVDIAVFDRILYDIVGGEYMACFASPDCSSYSKLQHLLGGPPSFEG